MSHSNTQQADRREFLKTAAVVSATAFVVGRGAWADETTPNTKSPSEKANIAWWYKQPGFFSQIWEFGGIRLFVDRTRLEEARAISDRIAPDGTAGPRLPRPPQPG